uniref:WAT1-related protein n=1 Tax=Quercus lobata TaxID=97700 RepID=A0A7N2M784_QUELO
MLMTLVKGPKFMFTKEEVTKNLNEALKIIDQHLIAGSIMLAASCFVIAFSVVLQGIISIGANFYLQSVAMKEKGLVFVTAFSPLTCRVIVTAIGSIIFSEQMNLGRVLGAIIVIILGLYLVMWGKAKDQNSFISANGKDKTSLCPSLSSNTTS